MLVFMLGCTGRDGSSVSQTREGLPDQESWKVTITLTDAGVTRAIIRAGHLEKYDNRQFILLDDQVAADFFDEFENHKNVIK